jgi:hypothetical protein
VSPFGSGFHYAIHSAGEENCASLSQQMADFFGGVKD